MLAADQKGPMGVTQLHLAALLPDGGTMAELLVLQCLPGALLSGSADGFDSTGWAFVRGSA